MTALVTGAEVAANLSLTYADDTDGFDQVAATADSMLGNLLRQTDDAGDAIDHGTHDACMEAALTLATEVYQARTAVGQAVGYDYSPAPVRVTPYLQTRAKTLITGCPSGGLDTGVMVG